MEMIKYPGSGRRPIGRWDSRKRAVIPVEGCDFRVPTEGRRRKRHSVFEFRPKDNKKTALLPL
jgi:Leu/Phe-tRNA-protein transferase